MGKKSRRKGQAKQRMPFVARTFEGLPQEGDWIAMREFVPSADAVVTLRDGGTVRVCSLLPGGGAGIVRPDGEIWLGLQVQHNFGDISRDLAHVVETARTLEPGTPVSITDPGVGDRLQDLVAPDSSFDVTVHAGFDYWIADDDRTDEMRAALDQANETAAPTTRLEQVDAAYWTEMGSHRYLRWVLPHPEEKLLDALARLQEVRADRLGDETRLIGSFRAHGLLVPVWETEDDAAALETEAVAFRKRLDEALADTSELTSEQRRVRSSLLHRQLTIR
ncbi:MAG: DUF5926 family protein [Aeromicrobium erythreum]